MTIRKFSALVAIVALFSTFACARSSKPVPPPKAEVRAVWITTASGLDWPPSANRSTQQASLRRIVLDMKEKGFNTLFFQVRARGDAYYRSRFEPWAENLTGVLGKDPGWDPLAFLLREAHAHGLEVHAWINVFKVRGPNPAPSSTPEHPSRALAGWCIEQDGEIWLDPGRPEVRTYLTNLVLDIVRSYDVDGINFDFIRYPGHRFADVETYTRYGKGLSLHDWRRRNITEFVRDTYRKATALKPLIKIGSSPLGVYRDDSRGRGRGSYYWVFQDSYGWLREGIHDYLSPQIYWLINPWNTEPEFGRVVNGWTDLSAGRQIYAGIAAYRPEIQKDLGSYIDSTRVAGLRGQAFFRLENITPTGLKGGRYRTLANIPPMTWKDSIPPRPVDDLGVTEVARGVYRLQWTPPPEAADGDTARYYNIYRWTVPHIPLHLPEARLAITSPGTLSFVDSTATDGRARFFYAIGALDRAHNESAPSPVVSTHSEPATAGASAQPDSRLPGSGITGTVSPGASAQTGSAGAGLPGAGASSPGGSQQDGSLDGLISAPRLPRSSLPVNATASLPAASTPSASSVPPPPGGPAPAATESPSSPSTSSRSISMTVRIAHETGRPTHVQYSLPFRTRVALDIILRRDGIPDTLQAMLVRAVQDQGNYKVNINNVRLPAGSYILRLTTENKTVEQGLTVEH
jgi:uncharacterized lipoprotein YddW (UPF0748 family)